ncbi:hypothetical protein C8R45DRAFT_999652, partial [Mycena sanguinolenta]
MAFLLCSGSPSITPLDALKFQPIASNSRVLQPSQPLDTTRDFFLLVQRPFLVIPLEPLEIHSIWIGIACFCSSVAICIPIRFSALWILATWSSRLRCPWLPCVDRDFEARRLFPSHRGDLRIIEGVSLSRSPTQLWRLEIYYVGRSPLLSRTPARAVNQETLAAFRPLRLLLRVDAISFNLYTPTSSHFCGQTRSARRNQRCASRSWTRSGARLCPPALYLVERRATRVVHVLPGDYHSTCSPLIPDAGRPVDARPALPGSILIFERSSCTPYAESAAPRASFAPIPQPSLGDPPVPRTKHEPQAQTPFVLRVYQDLRLHSSFVVDVNISFDISFYSTRLLPVRTYPSSSFPRRHAPHAALVGPRFLPRTPAALLVTHDYLWLRLPHLCGREVPSRLSSCCAHSRRSRRATQACASWELRRGRR